jgi:hypothetical protein
MRLGRIRAIFWDTGNALIYPRLEEIEGEMIYAESKSSRSRNTALDIP